jgi:predicted lipoprotein with Yx(FWY)xxD motif
MASLGTAPSVRSIAPVRARHPRRYFALALIPLAGVVAAACGSSGPTASPTTSGTTASAPSTPTVPLAFVTTKTVAGLGKILVNAQGQVLYTFTKNGVSVPCSASCLSIWPALAPPGGVTKPSGAPGVGTLGTTTVNGPTQVTVGGLPLYTYDGDSAPGEATGNNLTSFGGTWRVVKAGCPPILTRPGRATGSIARRDRPGPEGCRSGCCRATAPW